jgi:hypothetical protein
VVWLYDHAIGKTFWWYGFKSCYRYMISKAIVTPIGCLTFYTLGLAKSLSSSIEKSTRVLKIYINQI